MKCIVSPLHFHRQRRGANSITSVLDEIPGVGPKRKTQLLKHFGSVKKIREASSIRTSETAGMPKNLAESIETYFQEELQSEK